VGPHAVLRQRVLQQVEGAAVEGARGHHLVAGMGEPARR
jgi:hypothetical protein